MNWLKIITTVTTFFILSACGNNDTKQSIETDKTTNLPIVPIEVINPWIRNMPEGVSNTAGFMTIKNNTGKPLILKDVELNWARMAMIHRSKIVNGMATMSHQDTLTIDSELEFKPGGLHIMIMGMDKALDVSKDYNILLHFAGHEPIAVDFKVGQAGH